MKNLKKLISIGLSLLVIISLLLPANAVTFYKDNIDSGEAGDDYTPAVEGKKKYTYDSSKDGSIKVVLPSSTNLDTANNTFLVYKVFNATVTSDESGIAYSLVESKKASKAVPIIVGSGEKFILDDMGNVHYGTFIANSNGSVTVNNVQGNISPSTASTATSEMIAAIDAYVKDTSSPITPLMKVETTKSDLEFTIDGLDYGYYYVTTSMGSVVALASTQKTATITDKISFPTLTKMVLNTDLKGIPVGNDAIVRAGTEVSFISGILVEPGAINYVYKDIMDANQLTYIDGSLHVYLDSQSSVDDNNTTSGANYRVFDPTDTEVASANYTLTTDNSDDTFSITFNNDYLKTLTSSKSAKLYIVYKAKVTSGNLSATDPGTNTAKLYFGETGSENVLTAKSSVYNATITVNKVDNARAAVYGAGFVLKNASGKYYCLADDGYSVSWVDSINEATEVTTSADNAASVKFAGLAHGTYTIVEKTVPPGYNHASDVDVEVVGTDITDSNLLQTRTIVNTKGSVLPSTGGAGLYIVAGVAIVALLGFGGTAMLKRKVNGED